MADSQAKKLPHTTAPPPPPPPPLFDNSVSEPLAARGPYPGNVSSAKQYTFEQKIRRMQKESVTDTAREENSRLQGAQLIDSVRRVLQLYVVIVVFVVFVVFVEPRVAV